MILWRVPGVQQIGKLGQPSPLWPMHRGLFRQQFLVASGYKAVSQHSLSTQIGKSPWQLLERGLSQPECLVFTGAQNLWQLLDMRLIQPRLCSSWWIGQSRIPGTQKIRGNLVVNIGLLCPSCSQLVVRSLFASGNCLLVDSRLGQVEVPGSLWIWNWVSPWQWLSGSISLVTTGQKVV